MWNNEMLAKGYTHEPTELQKAIDQVGLSAIESIVKPHGHIKYCDMHGYYAVPGVQAEGMEGDIPPCTTDLCPLCPQLPAPNGTTASNLVELYIDLEQHGIGTNKEGI